MWSSRQLRAGLVALALVTPLALAGCGSFRPVYGEAGVVQQKLAFNYAKPNSRLEQIIIQELALRLGKATDREDAPVVRISAAAGGRALTSTGVTKPATQHEMSVTASYAVVVDGKVVLQGSRKASASYATVGQVLADEAAAKDAQERAAREVAQTIRLSILAQLAAPIREAALEDEAAASQ
jgi:LPS-assembly lipoprotein